MCDMPMKSTAAMAKEKADYASEEDHRLLQRAEEVRTDPKRMLGVRKHHRKMTRAMNKVGRSLTAKSQPIRASTRSIARR